MPASRAGTVASSVRTALAMERDWLRRIPEDDRRFIPWIPFQLFSFVALMAEAGKELKDPEHYLEIGSKMLIARDLFGLDARGFDRVGEFVRAACSVGLNAVTADAREYAGYGRADVIWFNRVARDTGIEAEVEVWRSARPGAVVICANLEQAPPAHWFPVLDDWDSGRRGIWQKPGEPGTGW